MIQLDMQKISREAMDAAMQSYGALSSGLQSATVELTDYAKRSYETGSKTAESLMGVRSIESAVQIQGDFMRSSYQGLVAQATKMGELVTSTAKQTMAPVEGLVSKAFPSA